MNWTKNILLWISVTFISGCASLCPEPTPVVDPFCEVAPIPQGVVSERLLRGAETHLAQQEPAGEGFRDTEKLLEYAHVRNSWMRSYQNLYTRMGCEGGDPQ